MEILSQIFELVVFPLLGVGTAYLCYLIKVKIALDTGKILGCEATGYLNMHEERKLEEPKITIEQAKEKLNPNLNILSEKLAIIPTKWKTEVKCYEFKGTVGEKEFIVYINANTGAEEDILVILETEGGILTI
jgi:germination protein YpeB